MLVCLIVSRLIIYEWTGRSVDFVWNPFLQLCMYDHDIKRDRRNLINEVESTYCGFSFSAIALMGQSLDWSLLGLKPIYNYKLRQLQSKVVEYICSISILHWKRIFRKYSRFYWKYYKKCSRFSFPVIHFLIVVVLQISITFKKHTTITASIETPFRPVSRINTGPEAHYHSACRWPSI